ncbi:MAG: FhaA domain-containing protein [Candidatus Nanopelagicales bacterium]
MGLLDNFEQTLDRMVNGAFAKAFKSEVQPVELAAGLQRELDDRASVVSRARTVVPNVFSIELAQPDYERLASFDQVVCQELAQLVRGFAQEQRYSFLGAVEVTLTTGANLGTGLFRIRSEVRPGPESAPPARAVGPGDPYLEVDGIRYPLRSITRLGRGTDVDIRVDDPGVSRHHAEITLGAETSIRDLNSTNGTLVNGRMVATMVLRDGARIQLGTTTITYRAG